MAQIEEWWSVDNRVYMHRPIMGICAKCFKIGTPLLDCKTCKVKVCPLASVKQDGTPSFFINPGFLSYIIRGENRDKEGKYNKEHWCTKNVEIPSSIKNVMAARIDVANKNLEMQIIEKIPHLTILKVLKGDLQGWSQEDKNWLQEVAKRSVLEWNGIILLRSKNKNKTSENTSTTS